MSQKDEISVSCGIEYAAMSLRVENKMSYRVETRNLDTPLTRGPVA